MRLPVVSFVTTVRHVESAVVGRTHASRVIPVEKSSDAASLMRTESLTPSKLSARPFLPFVHVAPEIVPVLARPELSARVVPLPASNA